MIVPSNCPPAELAGALEAGEDDSEAVFFGELLHAPTSDAMERSEIKKIVRGDWGIGFEPETANRVIESPCVDAVESEADRHSTPEFASLV